MLLSCFQKTLIPAEHTRLNIPMKAIEFFSGIGAFAYAARGAGVEVVAAFDQGQDANSTYEYNFSLKPSARNLDSLPASAVPDADLWWLSPPCTPYTVRGAQRDDADPRAQSLLNLIGALSDKLPQTVIVENVVAFQSSRMFERLTACLNQHGYDVRVHHLCPTMFGMPMKRPRIFIVASRSSLAELASVPMSHFALDLFIDADNSDGRLNVDEATLAKHGDGMNVVDPTDPSAYAICFTSGYGVSYKSSGSFIATNDANNQVRRFAPEEILGLLGFGPDFAFPPHLDLRARWRLAGNSVDIRCIGHLLRSLEAKADWVELDHDSTTYR
jgi:DNA (cytosine-5)-methyltransferase 1